MRKTVIMVAMATVLAVLGGGAVWAQDQVIHCLTAPCYGSGNEDLIYERVGNGVYDEIIMKGDHDRVRAQRYTNDRDVVKGGPGHDTLNVADGDRRDNATGGRGDDTCFVDARSEAPGCEGIRVR